MTGLAPASFDLVFTSPPAFPSHAQGLGALGTELDSQSYAENLGRVLFRCRRLLRKGGFLVLVIEPVAGFDVLGPLSVKLKRLRLVMLATYRWAHGDGSSWVIFLGKGREARLNRGAPAWQQREWAIPRPPPDAEYGFYEWPSGLVEAVTALTIPNGGRILDPYAGKASALKALDAPFEVVAVDVMPFDDEDSSSDKGWLDAVENSPPGGGRGSVEETC